MEQEIISRAIDGMDFTIKAHGGLTLKPSYFRDYNIVEAPRRYRCDVYKGGQKVDMHYFFNARQMAADLSGMYQIQEIIDLES